MNITFQKKYLILVFYDNRNLKISKSKKSEECFRDKIEIFIRLFDDHFARHLLTRNVTSYWQADCTTDSLETPPPPPGLISCDNLFCHNSFHFM